MKKGWAVLLCCLLLGTGALAEDAVVYEARSGQEFRLSTATENGRSVVRVPDGQTVDILEYGDDWCLARYDGQQGYLKTRWVYHFRSLDPMHYGVPGKKPVPGYIRLLQDTFISGGKFQGISAGQGRILCVTAAGEEGYQVPVWRGETMLPAACGVYSPFIAWDKAQPGDIIGGFTTFYGDQQGKYYPREREHNIILGCQRIHGQVIGAGETFSFNALCAPYSQNNGYQYAPNISKKGYGYGGGVCQVTTTLYNAVLTLPLQVEAWELHQYIGVAYVPQFFDAAVGSHSDFSFTNLLPYPIQLQALPQDGALTVLLLRAE